MDWALERLEDESPLTRTFALQALYDQAGYTPGRHAGGGTKLDAALLRRLRPIAEHFAEHGTPAMRARARRLLKLPGTGDAARRRSKLG